MRPEDIIYELDIRTYDILRRSTHIAPMFLVLLVMPVEEGEWLSHSEERLEIRRCAYWLSLRQMGPVRNVKSINVHIPRENQFTPRALGTLIDAVQGENAQ